MNATDGSVTVPMVAAVSVVPNQVAPGVISVTAIWLAGVVGRLVFQKVSAVGLYASDSSFSTAYA